jgi:hypothetical protein
LNPKNFEQTKKIFENAVKFSDLLPKTKLTICSNKGIITYLLGAGASANSLPIANKYSKRFVKFIDFLKKNEITKTKSKEIDKICTDFNWLIELIENKKSTVDSIAKDFFDKKEIENLKKLKKLLAFFFNIEQTFKPIDERYRPFIEKIWPGDRSNLPSNRIRILNWNYDCQVEMTLADLAKYSNNFDQTDLQRQCLPSPLYMHEDSIQPDYYKSFAINQFSICHLNGVCYCYKFDDKKAAIHGAAPVSLPFPELFDPYKKNQLYFDLLNRKGHFTAIEFAWEKPESNRSPDNIRERVIDKAIEATKDTEILMVIGYSFPKENLEFDKKIIASMKFLNKIYFKDLCPEQIINNFSLIYPEFAEDHLFPIKNVEDFFIPAI